MASVEHRLPVAGEGEGCGMSTTMSEGDVEFGTLHPANSRVTDKGEVPNPPFVARPDTVSEFEPLHDFSNSPGNEKELNIQNKKSSFDVGGEVNELNSDVIPSGQSDVETNDAWHRESDAIHFIETNETRDKNSAGSRLHLSHRKPGVILLGRGNSFSLGRSEVIVLHRRHKPEPVGGRKTSRKMFGSPDHKRLDAVGDDVEASNAQSFPLQTVQEKQAGDVELRLTSGVDDNSAPVPSRPPPPVSNSLHHPDSDDVSNGERVSVSGRVVVDFVPSYSGDMTQLWHKVESVMTQNNDRVRKLLEEFGIGKPGGGGGGEDDGCENEDVEERKKEEEELWHIIQENFQS